MKSIRSIFFVLSVFLLFGTFARAQTDIWAIGTNFNFETHPTDTTGKVEPFSDSIFYKIDPQTGIPMEIGPITGYTLCTGLDIHPISGEFFAVCDKIDENGMHPVMEQKLLLFSSMLLKIDETSGLPTEIGPLELSHSDIVSDISFRSDGVLFAHINGSNVHMAAGNSTRTFDANKLGTINTQSGKFSALGDTGLEDIWSAIGFTEPDDLIQCTDNAHSTGVANILNQSNGNATFLANLIYPPQFVDTNIIGSKDFDLASGQFFGFLESTGPIWFPGDETAASTRNDAPVGTFLVTIDEDGDIALRGQTSGPEEQFRAITVLSKKIPTEVPTLSEYGLIITFVLFLGAAVVFLRRRQVKSGI